MDFKTFALPRTRIERLARGETSVTTDTALRLGRLFGTSAGFWLNLQARFDLMMADGAPDLQDVLRRIEPLTGAAA